MTRARRAAFAVTLLALLAHGASLRNGFVYDDHRFVVTNDALLEAPALEFVLDPATQTADRDRDVYRPLRTLGHAFDRRRWGLEPFGFHLHSLLVHALNAALAVLVVGRLVGDPGGAVATGAGALLAVHPIGVEAVGWISSRGDLYAVTFTLLALLAALAAARSWTAAFGAALAAALATLGKESAAVLPLVGWLALGTTRRPRAIATAALGIGVAAALCLRLVVTDGASPIQTAPHGGSVVAQAGWALYGTGRTLAHLVWPNPLLVEYPQAEWARAGASWMPDGLRPWVLPASGLAIVTVVGAGVVRRRAPLVALWIGWALLAYLPSSSLLVTLRGLVNDRAAYPMLVPLGALAGTAALRLPRTARTIAVTAVLVVLGALTIERCAVFASDEALWSDVLAHSPRDIRAHRGLAALLADHDPARAEDLARRAVEFAPPGSVEHGLAAGQLAALRLARGRAEEAIPEFVTSLALAERWRGDGPVQTDAIRAAIGLARALTSLGRYEEADRALTTMLADAGDEPALHVARARTWWVAASETGSDAALDRARAAADDALRLAPDDPTVRTLAQTVASSPHR